MPIDEPPSPHGLRAFNPKRRLRVTLKSILRRPALAVTTSVVIVLAGALSINAFLHWRSLARAQSAGDSERVAFTLSGYIQLDTLQPAEGAGDFSTVAFAGQNIGGLPNNEAALVQHVVEAGETISTIAAQYNLHSGSIILANRDVIDDTELIHPGQVLFIPDSDASAGDLADEYSQRQQKQVAKKGVVKKTALATVVKSNDSSGLHLAQPLAYYSYKSQPFNILTHPGIDFATDPGTPVRAVAAGCVVLASSGWNGGYGNTLLLDIGGGYVVRYAHLSRFVAGVSEGDCFGTGQQIAYSGNSGRSTGPHLHFEVRLNGIAKNPSNYGL